MIIISQWFLSISNIQNIQIWFLRKYGHPGKTPNMKRENVMKQAMFKKKKYININNGTDHSCFIDTELELWNKGQD